MPVESAADVGDYDWHDDFRDGATGELGTERLTSLLDQPVRSMTAAGD